MKIKKIMRKEDIPVQFGSFVINSLCGGGKTTSIKQLILENYEQGILYCVDTVSNLRDMLNYLVFNGIRRDEIAYLVADEDPNSDIKFYFNTPEQLTKKKVILATHPRFFSSLIDYFLIYKTDLPKDYYFDSDFTKLMTRNDLRRFVFFDETPFFVKPFYTFPLRALCYFADEKGRCYGLNSMINRYFSFNLDKDPALSFGSRCKVNDIKMKVVFSIIEKNWDSLREQDTRTTADHTISPVDLAVPGIQTTFVIFEGVGDILFSSADKFKLITPGSNKYLSKVNFQEFNMPLKRYEKFNLEDYKGTIKELVRIISEEKARGNRSLVVVWKDVQDYKDPRVGSSYLAERIDDDLKSVVGSGYHCLYNGEAGCRGTNIYRDFKNIILVGKWGVPSPETAKFNVNFGTSITNFEHTLFYYVQLICRIGIRLHNPGEEFNVYFSSDFSKKLIYSLIYYFGGTYSSDVKRIKLKSSKETSRFLQLIDTKCNMRKDTVDYLKTFAIDDENLQKLIERQEFKLVTEKYTVSEKYLESLYGDRWKDKTKRSRLKKYLKSGLRSLMIDLEIV